MNWVSTSTVTGIFLGAMNKKRKKTHPLLAWRLKHPAPIEDDIKPGDYCVLKIWETNPSRNSQGRDPKIRKARTNYPYSSKHIRTLQRSPVYVLEVHNDSRGYLYIDLFKKLGIPRTKDDHGKRWLLLSDVRKVKNLT